MHINVGARREMTRGKSKYYVIYTYAYTILYVNAKCIIVFKSSQKKKRRFTADRRLVYSFSDTEQKKKAPIGPILSQLEQNAFIFSKKKKQTNKNLPLAIDSSLLTSNFVFRFSESNFEFSFSTS